MIDNNINLAGAISGTASEVSLTQNARYMALRPGCPGIVGGGNACYKWVGWAQRNASASWNTIGYTAPGGNTAQLSNWFPVWGLQWLGNRTMRVQRLGVSAWALSTTVPQSIQIAAWRCPSFYEQFATSVGAGAGSAFNSPDNFDMANTAFGTSAIQLKNNMPISAAVQQHIAQGGTTAAGISGSGGASGGLITWFANDAAPLFSGQTPPPQLTGSSNQLLQNGNAITDPQPFGCYTFSTANEADTGHFRRGIVWLQDAADLGAALELDNGMGIIMRIQTFQPTQAGIAMTFHLDWDEYVPSPTS